MWCGSSMGGCDDAQETTQQQGAHEEGESVSSLVIHHIFWATASLSHLRA